MNIKKISKLVEKAKNVLILLGLPIVIYYAYQIHNEQLKNKDIQTDLLNTRLATLQDGQINEVWDKYKSLKEFSEVERQEFKNILINEKKLNDSLKTYLSGAILFDKNRIILTTEQARKIMIDLIDGDTNKKILSLSNEKEINLNKIINLKSSQIKDLNQIIKNDEVLITEQNRLIKIQEKLINKK